LIILASPLLSLVLYHLQL